LIPINNFPFDIREIEEGFEIHLSLRQNFYQLLR